MIKRVLTSFLALSMTANLFLLSANADEEKDDKTEEKAETVEIKVTGYMADDWLAEYDEFSITFEHDGEEVHGYFDKDNKFERWIELQEGVEYNVTYSKELDGRLIEGFDETLTPSKDKTNYMIVVYPNHEDKKDKEKDTEEDKTEDSPEKDDKEKLDTAVKKLTMSEEELAEYKKQRELVENFLEGIDEYGLFDEENEKWKNLDNTIKDGMSDYSMAFRDISSIDVYKNSGFCNSDVFSEIINGSDFDITNSKYANELKEMYIFTMTQEWIKYDIYKNNYSKSEKYFEYLLLDEGELTPKFNEFREYWNNISEKYVVPMWKYIINRYNDTGEFTDLYSVYIDIRNGVEYEELKEESTSEKLSSIENLSSEEEKEELSSTAEESSISSAAEVSSVSSSDTQSNDSAAEGVIAAKRTFGDVLKDNIVAVILGIGLVIAVIVIISMSRKNKKQ